MELLKLFPQIDEVIGLKEINSFSDVVQGVLHLPQYVNILSKYNYDVIIDGQGLLKSGVFTGITKAKKKIGFAPPEGREGCHWFYTDKVMAKEYLNVIDKYTALLKPLGITELSAERPKVKFPEYENKSRSKIRAFFQTNFKKKSLPKIFFNPSASFYTKEIPEQFVYEFANEINKEYQVPLILLSNSDTQKTFSSLNNKNILLSPELSLSELLRFTNECDAVIGTDSGPTYMAEVLDKPSIVLFGPTNAERQSPSTSRSRGLNALFTKSTNQSGEVKQNVAIYSSYQCPIIKQGLITTSYRCIKRNCKDNICMKQFRVEDIFNQLKKILLSR